MGIVVIIVKSVDVFMIVVLNVEILFEGIYVRINY